MSLSYYMSLGKRIPILPLSLLGGFIGGGIPGGQGNAVLHWDAVGTTRKSINNQAKTPLNPVTDWITPRDGDLSIYEVQVTATGDLLTGSPTGTFMPANAIYFWDLGGSGFTKNAVLTVTVREILDVTNIATGTYTLDVDNTP